MTSPTDDIKSVRADEFHVTQGEKAMSEALMPQRQKTIDFYGDRITALQIEGGEIFVPLRQMCEQLGIGYQGQIDRIRRDPVLQKYEQSLPVRREDDAGGGGSQQTICLALRFVPGWLFGISASRVKEGVRDKLVLYQEQVYRTSARGLPA